MLKWMSREDGLCATQQQRHFAPVGLLIGSNMGATETSEALVTLCLVLLLSLSCIAPPSKPLSLHLALSSPLWSFLSPHSIWFRHLPASVVFPLPLLGSGSNGATHLGDL